MTKVQTTKVIDHCVEVVSVIHVKLLLQKFLVCNKGADIKVIERKFHQGLKLIAGSIRELESLELNNQNRRWSEDLKLF
jgi:hypothetical protein